MTPESLTFLANHLWQSTLFAAAAGLLTVVLRNNRASARYWIWLAASLKFLVPFSLLVSLGSQVQWHRTPTPAPVVAPLPISLAAVEIVQPALPTSVLRTPPVRWRAPDALLCAWLCGFTIVVARWARQWLRIRRAVRVATPLDTGTPVKVVSSPARLEPGVFGIFRPALLVPEGILDRLTPAQWRAILAHELCHARRRDNLTAAVHMAVEAIFWFYPLVWWIGKRLIAERERACDEAVLLAADDPETYAEGILEVCKMYLESPLACVSGVTGWNLKKRIREIMSRRVAPGLGFAKKSVLAIAGVAALAAPFAIGVLNAPFIRAQSQPLPSFEVATVKPVDPSKTSFDRVFDRERFVITSNSLTFIVWGYGLRSACATKASIGENCPLVSGVPEWARREQFEIRAKFPEGIPDYTGQQFGQGEAPEVDQMIQSLLEERFKLKAHREMRQLPVYALTVAKNGPKLRQGTGPMVEKGPDGQSVTYAPGTSSMVMTRSPTGEPARLLGFKSSTMQRLADVLGIYFDRPILDRTGLKGEFDFTIEYEIDPTAPVGEPSADLSNPLAKVLAGPGAAGPALFTALQEQLGLKLESTKASVEVLVVDHLERPSEN